MSLPTPTRSSAINALKYKAKVLLNTLKNSKSVPPKTAVIAQSEDPYYVPPLPKKRKIITPSEIREAKAVVSEADNKIRDVKPQPTFKKTRKEFKTLREQREEESKRTLFVGNLSLSVKEKQLRNLCSTYGEICSIRFRNIFGKNDSMSKGVAALRKSYNETISHCCAFVIFKEPKSAIEAAKGLKNTVLGNRHINASVASERQGCSSKLSVFVGSLPKDADEEEVRLHFRHFGPISSVRLIRDSTSGLCKGFGFVEFENYEGFALCNKTEEHKFRNSTLRVSKCYKKSREKQSSSGGTFYTADVSKKNATGKKRSSKGDWNAKDKKKKATYVKSKKKTSSVVSKKPVKKSKSSLI